MIKAMQAVVTQTSRIQKGNMFWEIWERGKKKLNEERGIIIEMEKRSQPA